MAVSLAISEIFSLKY